MSNKKDMKLIRHEIIFEAPDTKTWTETEKGTVTKNVSLPCHAKLYKIAEIRKQILSDMSHSGLSCNDFLGPKVDSHCFCSNLF